MSSELLKNMAEKSQLPTCTTSPTEGSRHMRACTTNRYRGWEKTAAYQKGDILAKDGKYIEITSVY